jgi:CheY-like chemotaxis protein
MSKSLRELRILVVEDEETTARALWHDLDIAFPASQITVAGTIQEGHDRLNEAFDNNRAYDVVILDFKLPENISEQNPESDFSLAPAVKELFPDLFIIHVSAYRDDHVIKRFLRDREASRHKSRVFIAKERGWISRVIDEIARSMHNRRIRRQFDELFRRRVSAPFGRIGSTREGIGRSDRARSLEVAALCDDAGEHWEALSPSLQDDLEHVLGHVKDPQGNHLVGAVKPETNEGEEESNDLEL